MNPNATSSPAPLLPDELSQTLTGIRRDLHANPQLAFEEQFAHQTICKFLEQRNIPFQSGIAKTGVVGWLIPEDPDKASQPGIALRADTDALPIHEETDLPYASQSPGMMHACGHDGHTTMLLGACHLLSQHRDQLQRPVKFIFQPAEEIASGAKAIIEAGALTNAIGGFDVESIYGLHGWPDLALGEFATRPGPYMAATDCIEITIHGQGGHAAMPHTTRDPIPVAAQVITALQHISSRQTNPLEGVVLTVSMIQAGTAHNIVPDTVSLTINTRSFSPDGPLQLRDRISHITNGICSAHGCVADYQMPHPYTPATINDPHATDDFLETAKAVLGPDHVSIFPEPHMVSEDFSYYGHHIKACFAYIGLRTPDQVQCPALHTPKFNFPDAAIPIGVHLFYHLATRP